VYEELLIVNGAVSESAFEFYLYAAFVLKEDCAKILWLIKECVTGGVMGVGKSNRSFVDTGTGLL
jgi:hypothetical protein